MNDLTFEVPAGWEIGLPLVLLALGLSAWAHLHRGLSKGHTIVLTLLRAVALLALVFLVARPTWVSKEPAGRTNRVVVLLIDRSESMSLEEGDKTRYRQALDFTRVHLLPALKSSGLPVQAMTFAEETEPVDGAKLNSTVPNGRRTNLGGAIARAVTGNPAPPLAVIALTDGVANENADNARGLSALVENRVPFIGVGFGTEMGARLLSLRLADAPPMVSTNTVFRISAELETTSPEPIPPFELALLRDGKLVQKKIIQSDKGSRVWRESFQVSEAEEGQFQYTVQFSPPAAPKLRCANTTASASVQVATEKELRVLYVQGALTWDYKFATWALKGDPSIKLTGLTRTSQQSVFRQNVESSSELVRGFPNFLNEIAPFRVVVLANLTPSDLSLAQQELLANFCGELGGGVLMIGGPATFNSGWRGSRIEQVLPVTFAAGQGVVGLDRPFRFRPTDDALLHPLFQIGSGRSPREIWAQMPAFTQYGRLDAAKPGAQIWAEHPDDEGPKGRRILMASQRFGAGLSAVISVQNLWRWRLAREADPQHFDRFWRQLLRFLSEPSRHEINISLADQDLSPGTDVKLFVERTPKPSDVDGAKEKLVVTVADELKKTILEQNLELLPARPVEVNFRVEKAGSYTIKVQDKQKKELATRTVEIRDTSLEFRDTPRNMETLSQWASLSDGLALKMEECPGGDALVSQIKSKVEQVGRFTPVHRPAGVNGWMLLLVLGSLGAEWFLRKRLKLG